MKRKYLILVVTLFLLLLPTNIVKAETVKVSSFKKMGVSTANNYLNVRKSASTSSKVVGKLYKGSVATVVSVNGDWVKITSGNVKGYVHKDYLHIGSDAKAYLLKNANPKVKVTANTLNVREKKSTNAKILGKISKGDRYKVKSQTSKWTKITYKKKTGYVSNDYVDLYMTLEYAVSVKEEEENIKQEMNASVSDVITSVESKPEESMSMGSKIANYAQKFLGNPYKFGGTSLTKGADCSGFIQTLFAVHGISIPRTSKQQALSGKKVSEKNMLPGDVLSYASNGTVNHVALYIGDGIVIHASNPRDGIKLSKYNYRSIYSIRRYV